MKVIVCKDYAEMSAKAAEVVADVMKKKGKEMSFADASKKLAQESEQRPNDPISIAGLEVSLNRLAEVQEAERMKKTITILLALLMVLSLAACGGPSKEELQREADRRLIEEQKKRLEEIKEENEKMERDFQKFYDAYDNYKKYN